MKTQIVTIRQAATADLLSVRNCAQSAYAMYIERIGQEPAPMKANFVNQIELGQIYVVFIGEEFAGYVVFYTFQRSLHLESVAVLPSHAGKGIGKRLIQYVENQARNKGLDSVELYTNEAMVENLSIYSNMGYVEVERKQQDGFDRVFFRKVVS